MIINGDFYLKSSESLISLGDLEKVNGDLNLSGCINLKSLGKLKVVTGDLYLWDCINLKNLGELRVVNGDISLVSSGITKKYINREKKWILNKNYWDSGIKNE